MDDKPNVKVPIEKIIRSCVISIIAVVATYAADYLKLIDAKPEIVGLFAIVTGYLSSKQKEITKAKAKQPPYQPPKIYPPPEEKVDAAE